MDFIDSILEMLRSKKEPADAPSDAAQAAVVSGAQAITNPGYITYKRLAEAEGEPVMSPEEYKKSQAGN